MEKDIMVNQANKGFFSFFKAFFQPNPSLSKRSGLWPQMDCILCGAESEQAGFCAGCYQDLPWHTQACSRCAMPQLTSNLPCAYCLDKPVLQQRTHTLLRYEFPLDHMIARLKYHKQLRYAPVLGQLLWRTVKHLPAPDVILPLPLHNRRLAERGYNQSLEISRLLSTYWQRPLETQLLYRQRYTQAQMKLDMQSRLSNPQNAFALNKKRAQQLKPTSKILLIDDVMTTGSTLNAAIQVLEEGGFTHNEVLVVARAV
jgi:ComF family protein